MRLENGFFVSSAVGGAEKRRLLRPSWQGNGVFLRECPGSIPQGEPGRAAALPDAPSPGDGSRNPKDAGRGGAGERSAPVLRAAARASSQAAGVAVGSTVASGTSVLKIPSVGAVSTGVVAAGTVAAGSVLDSISAGSFVEAQPTSAAVSASTSRRGRSFVRFIRRGLPIEFRFFPVSGIISVRPPIYPCESGSARDVSASGAFKS